LKLLTLLVRVKGMKKIDDKKIKGISIELGRSTKLNELDDTINDFKKNTDDKHEIDVRIDILNSKSAKDSLKILCNNQISFTHSYPESIIMSEDNIKLTIIDKDTLLIN